MASFQSQLGEGDDSEPTAEQLAASQRSISIAEFFEKNKQMLGFDSGAKALVTAVKEAVDNALDATEEAGILPDIYVEIEDLGDYYRLVVEEAAWERPHGTRIELEMEGNMRARQQLHDYIKYTAVVNPHARIEFHEPKESFKFERATDELPPETEEIRPHPHGVELGTLLKMLDATDSYSVSGFLQGEFTRVGGKTADSVIDNFRDRHFGREIAWKPPQPHEDADVEDAVIEAVANKGREATAAFPRRSRPSRSSSSRSRWRG